MSFLAVGVSAGLGVTQAVVGGIRSQNAQQRLENQRPPKYSPNQAISSYYQQALARSNTNPYASAFYNNAQRVANQNQASAISNLQDRRAGVAGVGAIMQGTNNALEKAGVTAEGLQRQDFATLGRATQMQAGENRQAFDINQMLPYDQSRALYEAQASGANQMENAGLQNIGGALMSYNNNQFYKNLIGENNQGVVGKNMAPSYSSDGTPLADTGGASVLRKISPAAGIGYINPNSSSVSANGTNLRQYLQMSGLYGGIF